MAAPTVEPHWHRSHAHDHAGDLHPGRAIWVYRDGSWRPGIVISAVARAVLVRYRPTDSGGTAVDTVATIAVAVRDDADPYVDDLRLSA